MWVEFGNLILQKKIGITSTPFKYKLGKTSTTYFTIISRHSKVFTKFGNLAKSIAWTVRKLNHTLLEAKCRCKFYLSARTNQYEVWPPYTLHYITFQ